MNEKTYPWKAYGGIMLAVGAVLMIVAIVLFAGDPHSTLYGFKKLYWAIGVGVVALADTALGLAALIRARNSETQPPAEPGGE
jgi:hypothetical protein